MIFFCNEKFQAGQSHAEYARYWRENLTRMPEAALRLSVGMLPSDFFEYTADPVQLHDARIQTASTNESLLALKLHGDHHGSLRVIQIQYDCSGLTIPDIPANLLKNKAGCDLICHEFIHKNKYIEHHMLFASGNEILIRFNSMSVSTDHDMTMR